MTRTDHGPRRGGGISGAAALEFGLLAAIFMMMVIGILIFGIYFAALIAVTNAAAEGARASVAGLSDTERASLATQAAKTTFATYAPFLSQTYMSIIAQPDPGNPLRFNVSVTYDFSGTGFFKMSNLVPTPVQKPTIIMSVADAGYY